MVQYEIKGKFWGESKEIFFVQALLPKERSPWCFDVARTFFVPGAKNLDFHYAMAISPLPMYDRFCQMIDEPQTPESRIWLHWEAAFMGFCVYGRWDVDLDEMYALANGTGDGVDPLLYDEDVLAALAFPIATIKRARAFGRITFTCQKHQRVWITLDQLAPEMDMTDLADEVNWLVQEGHLVRRADDDEMMALSWMADAERAFLAKQRFSEIRAGDGESEVKMEYVDEYKDEFAEKILVVNLEATHRVVGRRLPVAFLDVKWPAYERGRADKHIKEYEDKTNSPKSRTEATKQLLDSFGTSACVVFVFPGPNDFYESLSPTRLVRKHSDGTFHRAREHQNFCLLTDVVTGEKTKISGKTPLRLEYSSWNSVTYRDLLDMPAAAADHVVAFDLFDERQKADLVRVGKRVTRVIRT